MNLDSMLLVGVFVERNNRFLVTALLGTGRVLAHLPNPGRLKELLYPGARVLLVRSSGLNRKTRYQMLGAIRYKSRILLDTRLSNGIAEEAIVRGQIGPLRGYKVVKREFSWTGSRFDLLLRKGSSRCIVEVKACTLLRGRMALFPDAPTSRGKRHLETLARARRSGYRACVMFMVHRRGARAFSANTATDPGFSRSLAEARRRGVEVLAYECRWEDRQVMVSRRIPVVVSGLSGILRS